MLRLIFLVAILIATYVVYGQNSRSVEWNFLVRYDRHADFETRFFDRTYTNQTRLWGLSYGMNVSYLQPFANRLKFKVGVGYYKLVVDKVRQSTRVNTFAPARNIDYNHPTGIQPMFSTGYYHYNNMALTGGLYYEAEIARLWRFTAGGEFNYLYTFSQLYDISYGHLKFRTRQARTLGWGVNACIGVVKIFDDGRFYFNPKMLMPVYQKLAGDQVFGESKSVRMVKYFNGAGLALAIGAYF